MKSEKELDEILAEIGREHRAIGAPAWLEPVLFASAGSGKRAIGKPRMRLVWGVAAAVIVLAMVAAAGVIWQTSHRPQAQQARSVPVRQPEPEPMPASTRGTEGAAVLAKSGSVGRAVRDNARDSAPKQAAWNSLDEFVALPASEGLPPAAELSVVRVRLRASDLQQYGLQAPVDGVAQTMLADFVVGEDGLPRAIRIVRNTSVNGGEL
jgi:hypothetical protein